MPRPLSTHSTPSPSAPVTPLGGGVGAGSGGSGGGPRDLTSTLMESNMRNLSMASKANSVSNIPAGGGITAHNGQSGSAMATPSNSSMGFSSGINWGSASSNMSLRYDTAQSSLNSSTSSIGSAGRGSVDTSSFDSLFGSGGVGGGFGGNKIPMGMMGSSGGPTGASPMRPTSVMQPQGGGAGSNLMLGQQPRPNMIQNTTWAATGAFPPISSSAAPGLAPGPQFGGGGNLFQSNASPGWGGSGGPVIGPRGLSAPHQQGFLQPQRPQQQQQAKPLSNADLNDLLG